MCGRIGVSGADEVITMQGILLSSIANGVRFLSPAHVIIIIVSGERNSAAYELSSRLILSPLGS